MDDPGLTVGVALLSSERAGHIETENRRTFDGLLPFVRSAVLSHLAVERQAMKQGLETMATLGLCALVCNPQFRIIAATPQAEQSLACGDVITTRRSRLVAADARQDARLQAALSSRRRICDVELNLSRSVLLTASDGRTVRLDIAPACMGLHPDGAYLVVLIRGDAGPDIARLLITMGLTASEASTAEMIAQGMSAAAIAQKRGVSIATVRSHIANSFEKLGVNRQSELVARLRALG